MTPMPAPPNRSFLRTLVLLVAAMLGLAATAQRSTIGPEVYDAGGPCDTSAWKLVFHDEFGGTSLDRTKWATWFTYSEDGSDQCPSCRVMSGTNNIFRTELVSVSDGSLTLGVEARAGTWYEHEKEHESGMIHSIGDARFTRGRFEIRCRIPSVQGLWPAFWAFGGETEIDVFEFCGERPRWMKGSLHRWGERKYSSTGKHKAKDLSAGFHTYAVEWEKDQVRWYLDGELVQERGRLVDTKGRALPPCDRSPGTHPTAGFFPKENDELSLIVNLAVSSPKGYCKGPKDARPWPTGTALVVDHVRVYQRQPEPGLKDLCDAPRTLTTKDQAPLKPGEERRLEVRGPHGDLEWQVAEGLTVIDRDAHGATVRATGTRTGHLWVRVESTDDPCPRGALKLEMGIEVVR